MSDSNPQAGVTPRPDMSLDMILAHLPDNHAAKVELKVLRDELKILKGGGCSHLYKKIDDEAAQVNYSMVCEKCGAVLK